MFLMSRMFIGENLIKKIPKDSSKIKKCANLPKIEFRVSLFGRFWQVEEPTLELSFFRIMLQFKYPQGPFESSYSQLYTHTKNSSFGSKLKEI